jgi:hypothetical protein
MAEQFYEDIADTLEARVRSTLTGDAGAPGSTAWCSSIKGSILPSSMCVSEEKCRRCEDLQATGGQSGWRRALVSRQRDANKIACGIEGRSQYRALTGRGQGASG